MNSNSLADKVRCIPRTHKFTILGNDDKVQLTKRADNKVLVRRHFLQTWLNSLMSERFLKKRKEELFIILGNLLCMSRYDNTSCSLCAWAHFWTYYLLFDNDKDGYFYGSKSDVSVWTKIRVSQLSALIKIMTLIFGKFASNFTGTHISGPLIFARRYLS